jgi:ABC-type multidrug transport system ATPase subunit
MPETGNKIVEVKDLVKDYGSFRALEGISFNVFQGDVFGFLGPNGAGKSTTIRCMLSLIRPTSGQIKIFGKELKTDRNLIFSNIGCIVERPDFYKYLSAEKNLAIFARISGKTIKKNRIAEVLDFVGLRGRETDKISGFSNGMKQRLGIAQAIVHDPELIILDEPTTGLDPQGIIDIRNLILSLKTDFNKTILLSSHLLTEIELIANRLVIINKGKTLIEGNVNTLLNEEELLVSFETDKIEMAEKIAIAIFGKTKIHLVENNKLFLHVTREDSSKFNKELCKNDINVLSIESKRKLEEYFLKLVNQ